MPTTTRKAPRRVAAVVIDLTEPEGDDETAVVDLCSDADDHKPVSGSRVTETEAIAAAAAAVAVSIQAIGLYWQ